MIAASFDESNGYIGPPPDMTDEECSSLSVWRGDFEGPNGKIPHVISCWKVTAEELAEINRTDRIWLDVVGFTIQPVFLSGINPFQPRKVNHE
jgi:hypothetical protein